MSHSSRSVLARKAFTLVELLVVMAIIAILMGLLLPAVQKVRDAAARTRTMHNMRQCAIGIANYESAKGRYPPALDWSNPLAPNNGPYGTIFYHLLPFVEMDNLLNSGAYQPVAGQTAYQANVANPVAAYTRPVPSYKDIQNPGMDADGIARGAAAGWGGVGWGASYPLFGGLSGPIGGLTSWTNNSKRTVDDIRDGTSNTFMFVQKYTTCNTGGSQGGTLWAYWANAQWSPWFGYPALGSSDTTYVGPNSKFQIAPLPYDSAACNPYLTQSTRITGICVVFCDSHTAFISSDVSNGTWWALVTPASGDLPGADY
jgi:prepilin-type N-terminal cleavage/methylation domain-containing protein